MKFMGKAHVFGDNISADHIISAKYINQAETIKDMLQYCMEDKDENFYERVSEGDIIVAGENFGSGSTREHAVLVLKELGIRAVVARSFGRNFYRNSFNLGIASIVADCEDVESLDRVEIDLETGRLTNLDKDTSISISPLPDFMQQILKNDGLIKYFKNNGYKLKM